MKAVVPLPRNEQENNDLLAVWELPNLGMPGMGSFEPRQRYHLALGMDDIANEGQWLDLTGKEVTYFNWNLEPPNDKSENYVRMLGSVYDGRGKWYAVPNTHWADVLCQLSSCTVYDIVLECSPSNITLSVPNCFLDDKQIDESEIYIGETIAESSGDGDACHCKV